MPSVRSIILLAVFIFVVSIGIASLSLLRTPDSGGWASDSYGTRASGYRGLFETLSELRIESRRQLPPPVSQMPTDHTLVFLAPHRNLVGVEPAYLEALNDWIRRGGRVVVGPAAFEHGGGGAEDRQDEPEVELPDVLDTLGLPSVSILPVDIATGSGPTPIPPGDARRVRRQRRSLDELPEALLDAWTARPPPIRPTAVKAEGALSGLGGLVESLVIPGDVVHTVASDVDEPTGRITFADADDVHHALVADFPRGEGEIVVIGDPLLLANRFLAHADNSVLAVHLLSPERGPVIFDEFYHGLSVRGNPLYLLTRPGYAAVAVAVLLAISAWTWREAVFLGPPLPDESSRRRDIGEYVQAMARFFRRAPTSRPFLVREVRDGVLYALCQEIGLPPQTHEKDAIVAAIARRDPDRAAQLERVLGDIDDRLAHPQHWSETQTYLAIQRITACL